VKLLLHGLIIASSRYSCSGGQIVQTLYVVRGGLKIVSLFY
jgi:hypothetical protein